MCRRLFLFANSLCFVVAIGCREHELGRATDLPTSLIRVETESCHLGTVRPGDSAHGQLILKNCSDELVTLTSAKGSCSCTATSFSKSPIAPGGTTAIKVVLSTPRNSSGTFSRSILVTATAASQQDIQLPVLVSVHFSPDGFLPEPTQLDLGEIATNARFEREVSLRPRDPSLAPKYELTVRRCPTWINIKIRDGAKRAGDKSLLITGVTPKSHGQVVESIEIACDRKGCGRVICAIPVVANLVSQISLVPSSMVEVIADKLDERQSYELKISHEKGEVVQLLSWEVENCASESLRVEPRQGDRSVTAMITPIFKNRSVISGAVIFFVQETRTHEVTRVRYPVIFIDARSNKVRCEKSAVTRLESQSI